MPYTVNINNEESIIHLKAIGEFSIIDSEQWMEEWQRLLKETNFKKSLMDFSTSSVTVELFQLLLSADISEKFYFLIGVKVAGVSSNQVNVHGKFAVNANQRGLFFRFFTSIDTAKLWLND
jgi:hypothetical protein